MDYWQRLATAVRLRRLHLGWTQQQASDAGEVSLATWRLIETAGRERYQALTLHGVARALGWTAATLDRVGDGDLSPEEAATLTEATPGTPRRSGMPAGHAAQDEDQHDLSLGFARKWSELTAAEQAKVEAFVDGLMAGRND